MHRILLVTLFVLGSCELFAKDIFVGGPNASDNNPGTSAQPFATIQKAASVAITGDVVKIRSGIYRETIVVANSGITFRPDAGASVTISGFNVVDNTGWTVHSGNIYKKSITLPVNGFNTSTSLVTPSSTTLFANQIIRNGEMMFEARYPNVNSFDDIMSWKNGYKQYNDADGFKYNQLNDNALPTSPPSLVGGTIVSNGWYITYARTITGHDNSGPGGTERITYANIREAPPAAGHWMREAYYITGKLGLLDVEKEWHYESGTLYFYQPGGGSPSGTIEYKARNWGFDIRGRSNIKIIGLTFTGVDPVIGNASSTNALVQGTTATYNNHVVRHDYARWNGLEIGMGTQVGTKLLGANSVFKDNEWSKSGSIFLWMGPNCVVENNKLFDAGYSGNQGGALAPWEQDGGQIITGNTIYNMGKGAIYFGYIANGNHTNMEIGYNHFYNYGTIDGDGGASYAGGQTNTTGLKYHHNWIHDAKARRIKGKGGLMAGIYFDQATGGGTIHHNVIWEAAGNTSGSADLYHETTNANRSTGTLFNIYNNTFAGTNLYEGNESSYRSYVASPLDVQRNNIYRRAVNIDWQSGNIGNNQNYLLSGTNPMFVGSGGDGLAYRLQAGSPAVNAGIAIPGITDGSVGAPDIGAYEFGGEAWVPGYKPVPLDNQGTNSPPRGAITAPANNATFTQGSAITVTASASDDDGSVAKVEFFSGTTKLGEDATFPYSYVWNGAAVGTHSLTVKVTDNLGSVGTSAAVSITVNANPAPTVAITAPANNAQFQTGAPITITATAADANGTVTRVEFFDGATKLGEDLSAPYSFTWNNAAAGSHSLTAKATDNLGGVATSAAVSITVNVAANTAPTVVITGPADNAQFQAGANINITATAADANGTVTRVEFFRGTTKLGEDLTSPYSFTWNNAPAGNYSLTAKATDNNNSVTTSAAIDITVAANGNPVVAITAPANNSQFTVGAPITITATATDAGGSITKVEFFNGTTKLGEDLTSPYSFTWNNATAGSKTLTAKATDNGNNVTTSAAVTITVGANSSPVVSITAPSTGAQILSGNSISITATASDANGTVAKVEFFSGGTKLGEDLTSPYSFTWNNAPTGNHALTAKATDNLGATGTSATVNISVIDPVSPTVNAGDDRVITLPENSLTLTPSVVSSTPVQYNWTQVEGPASASMSNASSEQLSIGDLIEGIYIFKLSVTNNQGLTSVDEVTVTVVGASEATTASIPRFFSPNNDGTGDFWEWGNIEAYENSRLTIFSRGGQQVFDTLSYDNTWDGKLDGQDLQDGDYYYVIRMADLTELRGAVRIIR